MVGVLRIFPWGWQVKRYLFGVKSAFIRVFSLESNCDVGLEVREREYIFLRRSGDFVQSHQEWSRRIFSLTNSGREESRLQAFVLDWRIVSMPSMTDVKLIAMVDLFGIRSLNNCHL